MDYSVSLACERDRLELVCAAPQRTAGASLLAVIGGLEFHADFAADGSARLSIPWATLEGLPDLAHRLAVLTAAGAAELPAVPLLSSIDIRTRSEFLERVQSLRKRIKDPEAVRFCARRLLAGGTADADLRAAALCAIGYRIVEGLDPQDADLGRFWAWVEAFLAGGEKPERLARWTTSVTMCATYVAILEERAEAVERFLVTTLAYRRYLPTLSLLQTNFSRCDTLLALIELARGNRAAAEVLLADVAEVFRTGARSSRIDNGQRGRSQYSEIFAVIKSVRLAWELQSRAAAAADRDGLVRVAVGFPISEIQILTKRLEERGHWLAVMRAVAGAAAPDAIPAPPRRRRPVMPVDADGEDAQSRFLRGVLALSARTATALADGTAGAAEAETLSALMREEAALRAAGEFVWPALLELSKARFRLGCLAVMAGDRPGALALFTGTTAWTKQVLGEAVIEAEEDFDLAGLFVLAGSVAFLAAHRHVAPEQRLIDDAAIPQEFRRSLERVFRQDPLADSAPPLLEALAPA